jgi:hypothetical protein
MKSSNDPVGFVCFGLVTGPKLIEILDRMLIAVSFILVIVKVLVAVSKVLVSLMHWIPTLMQADSIPSV